MRYPYPWRAFLLQPAQQICAMIGNLDVNINVNPPTYFENLDVNIYKTKQ